MRGRGERNINWSQIIIIIIIMILIIIITIRKTFILPHHTHHHHSEFDQSKCIHTRAAYILWFDQQYRYQRVGTHEQEGEKGRRPDD